MILILLIGALAHRLWIVTIMSIIFMIFTLIVHKKIRLMRLIIFLIIPISTIAFFIGLNFFVIDPVKITSPFFDNSTFVHSSNLITNERSIFSKRMNRDHNGGRPPYRPMPMITAKSIRAIVDTVLAVKRILILERLQETRSRNFPLPRLCY